MSPPPEVIFPGNSSACSSTCSFSGASSGVVCSICSVETVREPPLPKSPVSIAIAICPPSEIISWVVTSPLLTIEIFPPAEEISPIVKLLDGLFRSTVPPSETILLAVIAPIWLDRAISPPPELMSLGLILPSWLLISILPPLAAISPTLILPVSEARTISPVSVVRLFAPMPALLFNWIVAPAVVSPNS